VVVATICAVYTWTLIWIWSLSQQKECWFLKQFAYPWRIELHICGAWATISSVKRVISRLQVLDWSYCEYHQVFVNGRSLHLTLGVAHCFTLIRMVSVAHFPGHFFLTAQNHGAECSLSRNLPRPSHFIVRDNDQLRYSAPLLLSSPLLIPVAFPLSISTNDAAHKFVHDHPQKALLSCSDYVRRLFGSLRRVLFRGILRSQSAGESVCESVRAWAKSSERIFKQFLNCSVRRTVR